MNGIDKQVDVILEIINALNDKTRQEIIMLFACKDEFPVNEIAEKFSLSRPTISHHLNLMRRSNILKTRKAGKTIYYSFNKKYVLDHLQGMVNLFETCC